MNFIVKQNNFDANKVAGLIAPCMLNIEYNKHLFSLDGKLLPIDDTKRFVSHKIDGITASIFLNRCNIVIAIDDPPNTLFDDLAYELKKKMEMLVEQYKTAYGEYPYKYVSNFNTYFAAIEGNTRHDRYFTRLAYNADKIGKMDSLFNWVIIVGGLITIKKTVDLSRPKLSNDDYAPELTDSYQITVDCKDILNDDLDMKMVNAITSDLFKTRKYMISKKRLIYSYAFGFHDILTGYGRRGKCVPSFNDNCLYPIYKREFKSIRKFTTLNFDLCNYESVSKFTNPANRVEDIEHVCVFCKNHVYDDTYVIKILKCFIFVCRTCFHSDYPLDRVWNKVSSDKNFTVYRIKHPRTAQDIIKMMNLATTKEKFLIKHINTDLLSTRYSHEKVAENEPEDYDHNFGDGIYGYNRTLIQVLNMPIKNVKFLVLMEWNRH